VLSSENQPGPSGRDPGGKSAPRRPTEGRRDSTQPDDALSRAVETLSAEICWFLATDADGRAAASLATGSTRPTSRRPRS